jgi:2-polyprenyl-6-methoxyphenol hydroxylase-like FAD-dependent oxidoreductase
MNKTSTQHALVIGCGIGGPVAAMALQRAGIDAVIYEAYDRPADFAGSFLNVASNGLDALRTLDAHRQVVSEGFPTPRMVMWSGSGKRLGEVPNGGTLPDGTTSITIRRGLLHRALRDEALRRGIRIEVGKRLVGVDSQASGVIARFEDGSRAQGDVLIGVDGLHSRARQIVDAAAPKPRYTGLLSLGGIARNPHVAPTPNAYHMIFGKRAFFGYSARPSGEIYWFANVSRRDEPTKQELSTITPRAWKRELLELFADDAGPARMIIDSADTELGAYPIHDMPSVPTWHKGAIVLAGDAAHATSPSSGQGAAMAIEDAIVLAKCLRDVPETDTAFATYARLRRARVEKIVKYSARVGRTKTAGPIGRRLRDLMMPFALKYFANSTAHAWMYTYHIDWSERIDAPLRAA